MARKPAGPKNKKLTGVAPVSSLQTTDQVPATLGGDPDRTSPPILTILETYRMEAKSARESGLNPRDTKWRENLDLYWNRYDFSKKASWQSKTVMPEVPQIVDRFAASLVEALSDGGNGAFYEIEDPADVEGDLTKGLKSLMDIWLTEVGRTPSGHPIDYLATCEGIFKLGALMNLCASVVWKELPAGGGYCALEAVDPRSYWLDHTTRGLYRVRRFEIEKSELVRMAAAVDKKGKGVYDLDMIEQLAASMRIESMDEKRRLSGSGEEEASTRKTITLDEYLCTIVGTDGTVYATNALAVVANEKFLIRKPEPNPNWHKRDWIVYTPFVPVPLSVYGRSYMENMGHVARLFTDMNNLLMDALYVSSIKAFVGDVSLLEDPTQLSNGLHPNLFLRVAEDFSGKTEDIIAAIDLGNVSPEAVQMWDKLKTELQEAGNFNELTAGGLATNSRTSASEVQSANQNGSVMLRSVARIIEQNFIEVSLDLIWKTNLQHMQRHNPRLEAAIGPNIYAMIYAARKELIDRPSTFKCKAITNLLKRQAKLKSLLNLLGIVAQNETLTQTFFQKVDAGKLLDTIFALDDIDINKLALTPREQQMKAIQDAVAQQQQQAQALATGEQPGGAAQPNPPPQQPQSAGGPAIAPQQGVPAAAQIG